MTKVEEQAQRDAIDAHQGWKVDNPYDAWTQEKQFNEWTMAFNAKLIELERKA